MSIIWNSLQDLQIVRKRQYTALILSVLGSSYLLRKIWNALVVPSNLRHIPRVNTLKWFWSLIMGENYDVRVQKLILPLMNEHGLCLKYALGSWQLNVGDPQLLQTLLRDMETFPKLQVTMDPDLILTNKEPNMGNASYKDWRRQRNVANPVFHRAMPVEVFGQITLRLFESIEKQNPDYVIDAADYMRRYALDCLGLGIFNFDMQAVLDSNSPYATLYKQAFSIARDPLVYLFPAYTRIPSKMIPYRNRARVANERLRNILLEIIIERKRFLESNTGLESEKQDLLTLMIAAAKEGHGGNYLSDGELISNLAVFFVAGHETTAGATASFMYYLAVNQNIQEKARQEVLYVLGDRPEDVIPRHTELNQMVYLNDCIRETMRINPPTSGNLPRTVTEDTNFGGYFIPKNTNVAIDLYSVHHLKKYWDKPEVFNPDRFNQSHASYRQNAVWMPFGDGPRKCIGLNFSLSEQRVIQAMLLKKYTWKLVPNSEHQHGLKNANSGGIGLLGPETLKIQLTKRY